MKVVSCVFGQLLHPPVTELYCPLLQVDDELEEVLVDELLVDELVSFVHDTAFLMLT